MPLNVMPNHALQRTRPSRPGCNRTPSWAAVAELGSLGGLTSAPRMTLFCFTGSLRPCVLAPLRFPRAPLQRKDARAQRRKGGFFTTARASRVADRTSSTESGVVDICASPDVLGIFEQEATERTEEDMTSVTSVSSCSQWFRGGLQPVRQTTWNQITHAL